MTLETPSESRQGHVQFIVFFPPWKKKKFILYITKKKQNKLIKAPKTTNTSSKKVLIDPKLNIHIERLSVYKLPF